MFGEEKGGIPSKHCFLSSGKRGASRTEKNIKITNKTTPENRVQKSPCVPNGVPNGGLKDVPSQQAPLCTQMII